MRRWYLEDKSEMTDINELSLEDQILYYQQKVYNLHLQNLALKRLCDPKITLKTVIDMMNEIEKERLGRENKKGQL